ncbi:MAG: hypothetical protein ACXADY_05065 [Candidatus Hodarchaeales archaeon]|jgi:sugar-specific transcriptional regulator TrmB
MGSTDKNNEKKKKQSVDFLDVPFQQAIPELIHQGFQGVRNDIQTIKDSNKDLKLMIRGIDAEIHEIKEVAKGIGHKLEKFLDKGAIKKVTKPHIKEISTGLDLITQIPQHLRDTFETILKRDKGSTASEVSKETGKSRSLESDYLNQLEDRGFIFKERHGKEVKFYKIGATTTEEATKIYNHNRTLDFIAKKKLVVNNTNNHSHEKENTH